MCDTFGHAADFSIPCRQVTIRYVYAYVGIDSYAWRIVRCSSIFCYGTY